MSKTYLTYRKETRYRQSVIHNFEVSVIMPFYKRLETFKKVLPVNAHYLQRNGIEVIIVVDSPEEEDGLVNLIKGYPFINWKVIVNDRVHASRNPAPVLNVGIRHATKKYILVSDPEVEFYTDVILHLREILENYPRYYATGFVAFVEEKDIISESFIDSLWFLNYGSIMVQKDYIEEICGYDENFKIWGGEDDNIRKRLDFIGVKKLKVTEAKSLHREKNLKLTERLNRTFQFTTKDLKKIYYPEDQIKGNNWGLEFNRVAFDWQNNVFAEELCNSYLKEFVDYKIFNTSIFKMNFKKIILAQSYNELVTISGFLNNMSNYFDGIILLDDGSIDGTYELAIHNKLLIKVKKQRVEFNDLQNRNILLNIASFLRAEWFCFMDIDERFDSRFVNFKTFEDDMNKGIISFRCINLWDSEKFFNTSLNGSINGVIRRMRMFRNIGRVQIYTLKNKLHFACVPHRNNIFESEILILHYGMISHERRLRKYDFYKNEDVSGDQDNYEELLDSPHLNSVDFLK